MSKFKNSFFGGYNKADVNAEISALNKKIEESEAESKPPVQPVVCSTPIRGDYWLDPYKGF